MENKSIESLLVDLESCDESERVYAVEDLCEYNDVKIAHAFISRLQKEKSQLVRESIAEALRKMISPEIFDSIYKMFYSEDAFIRNSAILIFTSGEIAAVKYLEKMFSGANNDIRKLILDSLFEIGTPDAVKVISLGLYDDDMNVMISSIEYLGRLCDSENLPRLIEILKNAKQPMLVKTILRSISIAGDSTINDQALNIMFPNKKYSGINTIYLCEIINLIGGNSSKEEILEFLELNLDLNIYAEEISGLLMIASARFSDIFSYKKIREIIFEILSNTKITEITLHNINNLLNAGKSEFVNDELKVLLLDDMLEGKINNLDLIQLLQKEWNGINIR